ncbi:hypothetical protein MTP99_015345 [Tenebrio molitor]|nr:hypothetical protein MTP99_015345 [Tenebrio molitor]
MFSKVGEKRSGVSHPGRDLPENGIVFRSESISGRRKFRLCPAINARNVQTMGRQLSPCQTSDAELIAFSELLELSRSEML